MIGEFSFFGAMLLALGTTLGTGGMAVPAFDRLVVFGDSLSDNGNAGRFSNGPVWTEQLAGRLDLTLEPARLGGSNFAVGGARLDPRSGPYSLRAQADHFLRMPRSEDRTLHIVYGGGNDLLAAVGAPDATAMVDTAVASLRSIVVDLAEYGATDILVPNLPDIGLTPAIRMRGDGAVEEARRLTDRFNAGSDRALVDLAGTHDLRLYRLDVHAMAERAKADPAAFGFADIATPCAGLDDCAGYVFWDYVHPTSAAHDRLADAAFGLLHGETPPMP